MITPEELFKKCEKRFLDIASDALKGIYQFPLVIPSNKTPSGKDFTNLKNDLVPLYQSSKAVKGKGYSVEWKEKKLSGISQTIPTKISFETFEDFLFFSKKEKDFRKIESSRNLIIERFPTLHDWVNNNPLLLLRHSTEWDSLLKVCEYFIKETPPHAFYIRELPIEVHSKFIETHVEILKQLLDQILPTEKINQLEKDFSDRYHLRKVEVFTHLRVLDDELKPNLGYDSISMSIDNASWLSWAPKNVFIIENQICYLTFPKVKNSVAIFGEGFKSRLSKHISWIDDTNLYCWFDLDMAGFEILNMVKEHYPGATSILMDMNTLSTFKNFAVQNSSRIKQLKNLNQDELDVYHFLAKNKLRLEQERIKNDYLKSYLVARRLM